MKVVAVVGTKKTGKTTLVTALVRILAKHGRVGTVKNMAGHPVDRGDTKRHFDAGADVVIGLGQAKLKVSRAAGSLESVLEELEADCMDFAVVEGFKQSRLPKIVLADIDVPNALRKVTLSELDEKTLEELAEIVLGLEEWRPLPDESDQHKCVQF
jgi:molybdopterin-guanine dinucleotide biosynthesis protein MobB